MTKCKCGAEVETPFCGMCGKRRTAIKFDSLEALRDHCYTTMRHLSSGSEQYRQWKSWAEKLAAVLEDRS